MLEFALSRFAGNPWGICAILITSLYYAAQLAVDYLPFVDLPEHDTHSRAWMLWVAKTLPDISSHHATVYQDPKTFNMACFFRTERDTRETADRDSFFVPVGLRWFRMHGHLFLCRGTRIYVMWWNNNPIKALLKAVMDSYLDIHNKIRGFSNAGPKWHERMENHIGKGTHFCDKFSDIQKTCRIFLDSENLYKDRGERWREGLLLYGDKGTGKSRTCTVLASELKIPIYRISLEGVDGPTFQDFIHDIKPRSLVVFEDMDKLPQMHQGHVHGKEHKQVSLASLNTFFDGAACPPGLILVITANKPELLDETLTRAGRIDAVFEFKRGMSKKHVVGMFRLYFPRQEGMSDGKVADNNDMLQDERCSDELELGLDRERYDCTPAELRMHLNKFDKPSEASKDLGSWLLHADEKRAFRATNSETST